MMEMGGVTVIKSPGKEDKSLGPQLFHDPIWFCHMVIKTHTPTSWCLHVYLDELSDYQIDTIIAFGVEDQ